MSSDFELNEEQQDLLDAPEERVLGVAGPGTGKTTVFVRRVCKEIRRSTDSDKAVCALTFTNAVVGEIREKLEGTGTPSKYPHFLGTIDAFLLQYVVQPFAPAFGLAPSDGVRLLAGNQTLTLHAPKQRIGKSNQSPRPSIYHFDFSGGTLSNPDFRAKTKSMGWRDVAEDVTAEVLRKKREDVWKEHGLMTHSDCAYVAAAILSDTNWGSRIAGTLGARFESFLIDEAQDVGTFRLKALQKLTENSGASTFIVGDPDQSIYQFQGASPQQLDTLASEADFVEYPLSETFRFGESICQASSVFSTHTEHELRPSDEDDSESSASLLFHDWRPNGERPFKQVREWVIEQFEDGDEAAVLARTNRALEHVQYGQRLADTRDITPFNKNVDAFADAVARINGGEYRDGRSKLDSLATYYVLGQVCLPRSVQESSRFDRFEWRERVWRLYLQLKNFDSTSTWNEWRETLVEVLKALKRCVPEPFRSEKSLGSQLSKRTYGDRSYDEACNLQQVSAIQGTEWPDGVEFMTVHAAKGLEFDVVAYLAPIGGRGQKTAVTQWRNQEDSEPHCNSYVACSRAKRSLGMFVHQDYQDQMEEERPDIVEVFESHES